MLKQSTILGPLVVLHGPLFIGDSSAIIRRLIVRPCSPHITIGSETVDSLRVRHLFFRQSLAVCMPNMPHGVLPRLHSSAGELTAWHSVLFRIWMADDTVIAQDLLTDRNTYATFGDLSGIVRFHSYAGGHEAGVHQLLRIFALPSTAITLAHQMWTAVRRIRDLHARAFLIALIGSVRTATPHGMGGVDFRVSRHVRATGAREGTRVSSQTAIANPRYNPHLTVVIRVDICWRLVLPFPEAFEDVTDDYI